MYGNVSQIGVMNGYTNLRHGQKSWRLRHVHAVSTNDLVKGANFFHIRGKHDLRSPGHWRVQCIASLSLDSRSTVAVEPWTSQWALLVNMRIRTATHTHRFCNLAWHYCNEHLTTGGKVTTIERMSHMRLNMLRIWLWGRSFGTVESAKIPAASAWLGLTKIAGWFCETLETAKCCNRKTIYAQDVDRESSQRDTNGPMAIESNRSTYVASNT